MKNRLRLMAAVVAACAAGYAPVDSFAQASFTDVSTSCGVRYAGFVGNSWDVLLGDVTNDGINDFYCMSHDQGRDRKSSLLYRSNSSLSLTDITGSAFGGITATGGGQGALFVDLDADGDLDLLTGSNDGVGCVLRNNGDGTFGWYEDFPGYYGDLNSRELSAGDMDGDGDVDVISGIHHRNMRIYRNNGLGVYDKSEILFSGETTCGSTLPIVADMDNDGDLDIVSQYMSAFGTCSPQRPITVDLWLNDGTGRIQWVSDTRGLMGGEEECAPLVGDFDNDGDLDIIQLTYRSQGINGRNRYYVNDGTGHFSEQSASRGLEGNTAYTDWWSKAITGDFDNDGDLDLYYRLGLWTNDGNGNFSHSELSGLSGRINGAGDLDGDGDLDLAGARAHYEVSGDGFWVFRNNTNDNNWLIVNVIDGTLNRYGIGAKISVYDGSRLVGYRQVIAASAMQQPLEQHFGLGPVSTVRVEVVFMDGTLTIWDDVSAGQEITITKESNPVPPSTPSWFVATGTDFGCADLQWETPAAVERVTEYVLAWGTSPGVYSDSVVVDINDVTSQGGTSSYRHCLGVAGEYCFVLRAHNAYDLWSAYSAESCADITNDRPQPPSPPTNVSVQESDFGTASVSWDPVGDALVTGYTVYYGNQSVDGGQAAAYDDSLDAGDNTTALIPGFAAGTYYFAVKSYTAAGGRSAFSGEVSLTMAGTDVSAPTIVSTNPADGATDVPLNMHVFFTIADDKAGIDRNSLTVTANDSPITALSFSGDEMEYAVTATPAQDFAPLSPVVIEVTADDMATPPNRLVASWSFQTADRPITDTEPPVFGGTVPANGATNVAADSNIRVEVSDAGMGIDVASMVFYVDGSAVSFRTVGDPFNMTLIYDNAGGFTPGSSVSVRVTACDVATPANCGELSDYAFTVASSPESADDRAAVVPNGYWANDPTRPLEVRDLPLSWTVRIFDTAGRLVRSYTNRDVDGLDWTWDFTNDHGQRVARALYLVRVTGPDGSVRQSGRFLVQTDR
jgi:hypothetical protein